MIRSFVKQSVQLRLCKYKAPAAVNLREDTVKFRQTSILALLTLLLICCGTKKKEARKKEASLSVLSNSLPQDTFQMKESFAEKDVPQNEYLVDRLEPIRANFERINSITNWTCIDSEELSESSEGGEAKYYYQDGKLEKIVARRYGETFQLLSEYFLRNGQLSFVFEKHHKNNRPIYYDTTTMKENNDTEAFDLDDSELSEDRSYFENGKLLHQVNNQDCGSPFDDDYLLKEQKRIKADFDKLIVLTKNK